MKYRLLIIALLVFMSGCIKDPDIEPYVASDSNIFTLSIESYSDEVVGSTRSSVSSTYIDRGYIFYYDSSGSYLGCESIGEVTNFEQSGSTVSFSPKSTNYTIDNKIIAIFNYDAGNYDCDQKYFPLSADYLKNIETEMYSGDYSLGMPMYVNDFTDTDRATREVYRSVARMELFIKEDLTIAHDSHTHDIGERNLAFAIVNSASEGTVGIGETITVGKYSDFAEFDNTFPYSLTEYEEGESAKDTDNKIYLFPFSYSTQSVYGSKLDAATYSEERFSIILKHSDTNVTTSAEDPRYYKLNLLDKATSTYFDVVQNHNYRVVITAVNSRGYASVEEAYKMPPSNIEYEIYDDQGGLTYSNGQYAISMDEALSYDEILVYGSSETTVEFNNIRYVLPDGGEMASSVFDTNEITFNVVYDNDGLIVEKYYDFDFDDNGKSQLTTDGQSIKLTLSGEGECTIQLRIKLGNLEMGRDEITITKVATNGDGDGSFDAHPNHFELADQEFVAGSWQSDDIDFGARASSSSIEGETEGGTVIYMGENATPTGYRTMDGYVSGQYSVNSYPVFSPKTRKGYYSYIHTAEDGSSETRKVMIQLDQLEPYYLGHFGSASTDESSLYHYKGLICEKIEEVTSYEGNSGDVVVSERDGVMVWSEAQETFYTGEIWGDYLGMGDRYLNLVDGLAITQNIVENKNVSSTPTAARYCYMKNDVNGNGKIDDDEAIVWYLPAQNQALAMWINMNIFEDPYKLNNMDGDSRTYYWTCSEVDDIYEYGEWSKPTDFSDYAWAFNMLEGQSDYYRKSTPTDRSSQSHVRCVRGLD